MPAFNQAGSYNVAFLGNDGNRGSGSASTAITVNPVTRAPRANANGPYSGGVGLSAYFSYSH